MVSDRQASPAPELPHLATPFFHRLQSVATDPVVSSGDTTWTSRQLCGLVHHIEDWITLQAGNQQPCTLVWEGGNHPLLAAVYLACVASGHRLALVDPGWSASVQEAALSQLQPACRVTPEIVDSMVTRTADTRFDVHRVRTVDDAESWLDSQFLVAYTSGTTGTPRALVRTQRSWLASFIRAESVFGLRSADRILIPGPLHFTLSFFALANGLHTGAHLILLPRFDPHLMIDAINRHSVDVMILAPTLLATLIASVESGDWLLEQPTTVRLIICAGDKLPSALRSDAYRVFPEVRLMEYYGASEFSFIAVNDDDAPAQSVGRLFPGVSVCTRDTDGNLLEPGEPGVLCVDSDMLATGYLDEKGTITPLSSLTSVSVGTTTTDTRPGWHAGDLGCVDDQSHVYMLGRLDDRINTGGVKVYPVVIENLLREIDGVAEVLVTGIPDPIWGQQVVAVVSLGEALHMTEEFEHYLQRECRQQLGESSVPRRIIQLDSFQNDLPDAVRLPAGKLSRKALANWLVQRSEASQ